MQTQKQGGKYLRRKQKRQKRKKPLRTLAIVLGVLLLLEGAYFFLCYSKNEFISYWREAYIATAMSTMRHRWLAEDLLPASVVREVTDKYVRIAQAQQSTGTTWQTEQPQQTPPREENPAPLEPDLTEPEPEKTPEEIFYERFWELDRESFEAYLAEHPEALENGWESILINEAGLDDAGTSIRTVQDEQVLAVDAKNQILLLRVEGSGYRGVLAVAKDPARLSIGHSQGVGQGISDYGQTVGVIAQQEGAVLAMTASGFIDVDSMGNVGNGNGSMLAGLSMSHGNTVLNYPYSNYSWHSYRRLEIRKDDRLYICPIETPVSEDCRDAMEFEPAVIVDGQTMVSDWWVEINPRSVIGQSDRYEILMLAIEGRNYLAGILGTDINECARILERHGCVQALNADGGASMMLWYDGEYLTRCANLSLSQGRPVPNAFCYGTGESG